MKIMVLVPSLAEKGPVIVAENISKYSKESDIDYLFVSLRKNEKKDLKRFKQFKVIELEMTKSLLMIFKKIKKIIKEEKIDIVHSHCFWPTIIASRIKGTKKITTLHNNPWEDYTLEYGSLVGKVMAYIQLKIQKKFDVNIAISEYVKEVYMEKGLKNIEVIYNGIENKMLLSKKKREKKIKLITVSVLNKRKNIYQSIDVIEALKERNIDVELKIIGDGPEKDNIINYTRQKKIEKDIKFYGKIPREEVFKEIYNSDIFILTSKSEGFGLVVAEAMAVKIPSIVNDIPVMQELIENKKSGIIASNIEEFVEGILFIKKNIEEFSENSFENYLKKFKNENMIKNYEVCYRRLLKGGYLN